MTKSTDLVRELFAEADEAGDYVDGRCSGAGIVICAGGAVMLANAYVLVRVLRDIHKTELPIEIWHLGPAEMPDFLAKILEKLGCVIVDALSADSGKNHRIYDGWQLKAFALKHSSFEQVILLDADQVPLLDPALALDWPEYIETGAVFWPDVIDIAVENPVWQMLGLDPGQVRSWESGQMCINKKMQWRSINLVLAINERAESFYRFVYGDKDTFLLAWQLNNSGFALVPHLPFQGERYLVQRDFSGNPFFQHHTNCKWSLTKQNENHQGLKFFDECQEFLDELKMLWDGYIFHAPSRSLQAQFVEAELTAVRHYSMTSDNPQPLEVELLPGHQIGTGRSHKITNWYVDQRNNEFILVLGNRHRIQAELSRQLPDSWLGDGCSRDAICLEPLAVSVDQQSGPAETIDLVAGLVRVAGSQLSELDCALELLARMDPAIIRQIEIAAASLRSRDADVADHLSELAARLASAEQQPPGSVRQYILGDPKLYVSP